MTPKSLALIATLLLPSFLSAQIVGGKWSKEYRYTGVLTWDMLGTKVAGAGDVDGDGTPDLLVAAPQMDTSSWTDNGVVFVYSGSTGLEIWRLEGVGNGVLFGSSVANAGDVNADGFADMIVGAPKASGNGFTEGGTVTVYSGADGMVLYTYGGNSAHSKVGQSVASAGDVNADGYADFIYGGYLEDPNGSLDAGTALVYSGKDGQLIYQFNGENDWDWFGHNVSTAGDINSDSHADIMVAAINTNPNGIDSAGSVYVYSGASGALLHRFDGDDISGWYGWSLCDLGDLDTDGINDLAIGSPWVDSGGLAQSGLTQVFSGATGLEIQRWEGQEDAGHFGNSISNARDVDGDGVDDLLVGAKWENLFRVTKLLHT
ncbi:MAG: FG-GAP repeat protein [Planctomycetes bacterium]|nr:FG-GAP repeat protein [Planctomycetota bacterium]